MIKRLDYLVLLVLQIGQLEFEILVVDFERFEIKE